MNTVDLFSGIGGFALGLRGVCKTICYCEIDPLCTKILERNMRKGRLDKAPVFEDVTTLPLAKLRKLKPEMITAGFPCQDISVANTHGKGLKGKSSAMFFHVLRVVDALPTVRCVLMENSSNIVKKGLGQVKKSFIERGWSITWSIFTAKEAGRPHLRRRWVALACAPGFNPPRALVRSTPPRTTEPPRVIIRIPIAKRCGTLGNSVVPHAMRMAFDTLVDIIIQGNDTQSDRAIGSVPFESASPHSSVVGRRQVFASCKPQKLVFTDGVTTFSRDYWVTPIKSAAFWSRYINLDPISIKQLPCQVLHERNTFKNTKIQKADDVCVSPVFVEWLMGYPRDWTLI